MPGKVLISPSMGIDPEKKVSDDIKKREELHDVLLRGLVKAIKNKEVDPNITVEDLCSTKKIDDDNPYKEAFSQQSALTVLSTKPTLKCVHERIEVTKTLVERGYDVWMLAPTEEFRRYQRSYCLSKAEDLGARLLDTDEKAQHLIDWCRDAQMQIGDIVYNYSDLTDDWFRKMGCDGERVVSQLGEGGMVVDSDKFVLVSDELGEKELGRLRDEGLHVHALPRGIKVQNYYYRNGERVDLFIGAESNHIDLFVNTIPEERLMIVKHDYYHNNKREILKIAKKERYKAICTNRYDNYLVPTNFLALPDGMYLINNCNRLYSALKNHGLSERVIMMPTKIYHNSDSMIGNIRCFTNTFKSA